LNVGGGGGGQSFGEKEYGNGHGGNDASVQIVEMEHILQIGRKQLQNKFKEMMNYLLLSSAALGK